MNDKIHTREGYEQLLQNIQKQTGQPKCRTERLSDYELMVAINVRLIENNCVPYSCEELEIELN